MQMKKQYEIGTQWGADMYRDASTDRSWKLFLLSGVSMMGTLCTDHACQIVYVSFSVGIH